jgi:hypothetical protein
MTKVWEAHPLPSEHILHMTHVHPKQTIAGLTMTLSPALHHNLHVFPCSCHGHLGDDFHYTPPVTSSVPSAHNRMMGNSDFRS